MKRSRMTLAAIAFSLVFGVGGNAEAQDFTVNLPVNLTNMPVEITAVVVDCVAVCQQISLLFGAATGISSSDFLNDPEANVQGRDAVVGSGRQVRAINTDTGEFHETVTIAFSTDSQHFPNNVGAYVCWMKIRDNDGREEYPISISNLPDHFRPLDGQFASENLLSVSSTGVTYATSGAFANPAIDPTSNHTDQRSCEVQ